MNAKEANVIAWQMVQRAILSEIDKLKATEKDPERLIKLTAALNRCWSQAGDKQWKAQRLINEAEKRKAHAKNCPCSRCGNLTGKPKPPYDRPIYCDKCTAENVARWREEERSEEEIARLIVPNYAK